MTALARLAAILALSAAAALPAAAQGKSGKDRDARPGVAAAGHCPPGLAKKSPPCIPPGQVGRGGHRAGDRYEGDLTPVDRTRYVLPPLREGQGYVRSGDRILLLDREERIVIDVLDLVLQ